MLGSIGCYIHAIKLFNETAFSEEGTYNSQATGGFVCKFNNNVLVGVQCDPVVVIHGKRLQSIGFAMSILP